MTTSIQAYRCGDFHPGEVLRRKRGIRVATTIARALEQWVNREGAQYGESWPARVFVGSVEHADVLSTEEHMMRVSAMRLEREVPPDETFGPRADELIQCIDDVDRTRWLRPGAGIESRLPELVAEHYAALSDYGPVTARPLSVVRTWHEARDAHAGIQPKPEAAVTAISAACSVMGMTTQEIAIQLAQHKITKSAYFGVWEAAWAEAGRSLASAIHALPLIQGDPGWDEHYKLTSATESVDGMVRALGAAREPAFQACWDATYDLFTYAPGDVPSADVLCRAAVLAGQQAFDRFLPLRPIHPPGCRTCAAAGPMRDESLSRFITHTTMMVWTVAMNAALLAGWRVSYLINAVPRSDPWRPLIDIWRLGCWPLGATKSSFLVFVPELKA